MTNLMRMNYLTESKCILLKNQMRKDFFNRLDKVSMRHFQPNIIKDIDMTLKNKNNAPILMPQTKAKQISERIRHYNRSHMKKKHKLSCSLDQNEEKIKEGIEEQIALANKKSELPKIEKKVIYDPNEPKYETKYIEKVEKQFIKPFLNNQGNYFIDYIKVKRSRIPFNFSLA